MTELLPIFPLGTVLFPGLVLPLHIFEERYRLLVHDLLETPEDEPRRFGVVGLEIGHEVGSIGTRQFAPVGCTAELRGVNPHDDGRFDIVTTGGTRFRIEAVDESMPYLRADVTSLPDLEGPDAGGIAEYVTARFRQYCAKLLRQGAIVAEPTELPADPIQISYLIAASMVLDRADKQQLLEAEHAADRLRLEYSLLSRENKLLQGFPTVPASELLEGGSSPN